MPGCTGDGARVPRDLEHQPAGPPPAAPLFAIGDPRGQIDTQELENQVGHIADHVLSTGARRVLLVPPDHTRLHSGAGAIVARLYELLAEEGLALEVLPATGTHRPMGAPEEALMFGGRIPARHVGIHRWREDVVRVGELTEEEVGAALGRPLGMELPLEVNREVLEGGYDLVVAVGQVVPHEVAGFSGFTKHLCIGLGGRDVIHRSHFLGAVHGIERTMGQVVTPVRLALDLLFDRYVEPRVRVLWIMTVVEYTGSQLALRGLFGGEGGSISSGGAAFRAAAELALRVNVRIADEPYLRCVAYLDPRECRSAWLGNKAIYRTRMAMADGGDLVVLAPAIDRFGEDREIDELIRHHGYRGTDATLAALETDPALSANLAAAAHLVHGSPEGRFTVTFCPGPGLTRADVEGVGFRYCSYAEASERYRPDGLTDGVHLDTGGKPFVFIRSPGLGLWSTRMRLDAGAGS